MTIEMSQDKDPRRAKIFFALSDPSRIEIIRMLKNTDGELGIEQICQRSSYDLTPSTRSYHNKILQESGLMLSRKEGREKLLRLNRDTFEQYLPGFLNTL